MHVLCPICLIESRGVVGQRCPTAHAPRVLVAADAVRRASGEKWLGMLIGPVGAAEKYRLIDFLGKGGNGSVYLALDERNRQVAVKMLDIPLGSDGARKLFHREAKSLESLKSVEGVVRYLDHGVLSGFSQACFVAMEYVEGARLTDYKGRTVRRLDLVAKVLDTLGSVHARGVIHRDVKPSNIIVREEQPVLLDFGIAKAHEDRSLSTVGRGTPGYMAPEQWSRGKVDKRADLYSVGVLIYWAVQNEVPGDDRRSEPLPRLSLPEWRPLDAVIRKATQVAPARRYKSAEEMEYALRRAMGECRPVGLGQASERDTPFVPHPPRFRVNPLLVMVILLAVSLVAIGGVLPLLFEERDKKDVANDPPLPAPHPEETWTPRNRQPEPREVPEDLEPGSLAHDGIRLEPESPQRDRRDKEVTGSKRAPRGTNAPKSVAARQKEIDSRQALVSDDEATVFAREECQEALASENRKRALKMCAAWHGRSVNALDRDDAATAYESAEALPNPVTPPR